MAKTQFGPGVVVTSKFLNGAQQIFFDSKDEDWHYDHLDLDDIQKDGDTGFDSRYVTLTTQQTITGDKLVLGKLEFGEDGCPGSTLPSNAPLSHVGNCKWYGGTTIGSLDRLEDADIITKLMLIQALQDLALDDLADVECASPGDEFILSFNASQGEWTCGDVVNGGFF